ncbi:MAG TPA: glycoside hydrolase family 38 C-terminal domain-containing protein [Acidimicrobiales bacterium]|nr:glycoside hydrolase family 38 C-terminal domain-containing protein [Acidimicrobiales bacterium]
MGRRRVAIVPHTHWDREWYTPFEVVRLDLVELLEEVLDLLETDETFTAFVLDGQAAPVDDYLELRPQAEDRIRRLVASGRLEIGPWYVAMDEFLVSGETIVRNLRLGLDRAAHLGGAMVVGYLPDNFGHVGQMPQLLRAAGIDHAVVWRGVPTAVDRTAFWWAAPGGSTVRAEYLPCGYGNGAALPADAAALTRRLVAHEAELGKLLLDGILLMNGTDRARPYPGLGALVAATNRNQQDFELQVTSLGAELARRPTDELPRWTGELRSGHRAHMLRGVASTRLHLKQAAARAERALEREAEPLCALFLPAERWPGPVLDAAWLDLVRSSAHDSIAGCTVDDVAVAVRQRFVHAAAVADAVSGRAVDALASSMADPGAVVVNTSARSRGGVIELVVPGDGDAPAGTQLLEAWPALRDDDTLDVEEVRALLGRMRGQDLGDGTYVNGAELEQDAPTAELWLHTDRHLTPNSAVEQVKRDLYASVGSRPDAPVRVHVDRPASRRVLARAEAVPGLGWATWAPAPLEHPVQVDDHASMRNGLVTVAIDPAKGSFALDGCHDLDRLVDEGDQGDTYTWSPPAHDTVVDRPEAVAVEVLERGPVRGRVVVSRTFAWPERVDDHSGTRVGARSVVVTTTIELRAGERLVRVTTNFDNPCRDHRLRTLFRLPVPAATSLAECAFGVVERGLETEGSTDERGVPTFPSRRFVTAGNLTVVHEGLLEYELIDIEDGRARTLALTLLRATGMLSRPTTTNRRSPAGPPIAVDGAQMRGPVEARYAVCVGPADPYAAADDALLPLLATRAAGGGGRAPRGQALAVTGAELSSVRREGDALEVRVFNPTATPTSVSLGGRSGHLVDLVGRKLASFEDRFELGPWKVATARVPAP